MLLKQSSVQSVPHCFSGILYGSKMRLLDIIFLLIFINPVAAEVECDPPIPPEHGTVNIFDDEYSAGSRVEYTCDEGRTLVGSASSRCLDSGKWTSQPPTCAGLSSANCSKFNEGDLAIYYDKEQAVDGTAVFSCKDPRKQIDGPSSVTCLASGQWSDSPPKCKTACPKINETEGMTVFYSNGFIEGSIASFHCVSPRTLYGVSSTKCLSNGIWMNPRPQCILPS